MNEKENTPKEAPKKKVILETIPAQYNFSIEEIGELARKAALENQRMTDLENPKKQVTSGFKADIEACQAVISSLSDKIASGFEMRDTECEVDFNVKEGKKTYRHKQTGVIVRTAQMTQSDFQQNLPIDPATVSVGQMQPAQAAD